MSVGVGCGSGAGESTCVHEAAREWESGRAEMGAGVGGCDCPRWSVTEEASCAAANRRIADRSEGCPSMAPP